MLLHLDNIRRDGGTQSRSFIDDFMIAEYKEAYKAGAEMPPIVVFYDGTDYWLADGFHRIGAYPITERDEIEAKVLQGTREDAVWYSCGANKDHGIRRSSEDKRRSVEMALRHPKSSGLSDRALADHCGVGHVLVSEVRKQVFGANTDSPRTGKDGKSQKPSTKKRRAAAKKNNQSVTTRIAEALNADPGRSNKSIADEFKCSSPLVSKVRKELGLQRPKKPKPEEIIVTPIDPTFPPSLVASHNLIPSGGSVSYDDVSALIIKAAEIATGWEDESLKLSLVRLLCSRLGIKAAA